MRALELSELGQLVFVFVSSIIIIMIISISIGKHARGSEISGKGSYKKAHELFLPGFNLDLAIDCRFSYLNN